MTMHSGGQFVIVDEAGTPHAASEGADRFGNTLALLASNIRLPTYQERADGAPNRYNTHAVSGRILEAHFDSVASQARSDAFDPNGGMFRPRDLAHKMRRVLEEALPPLNSRVAFPVNTEVSPGSKSWEQSRFYGTSQAVVYRGGSGQDIPEVGLSQQFQQAPVVYLVSAASMNILDEMAANRTGLDINGRKLARARLALLELTNKWTWEGSQPYGLLGLLNHPYIDTAVSQVSYVSATDASDILSDLYYWADYAHSTSGGAFQSDTLLVSNKLHNFLSGVLVPDTNGSNVLEMLVRHKPHIKSIIPIRELDDKGGANVHVMTFTRRGTGQSDTSAEIISVMEPTMLPAERGALSSKVFMMAAHGGLNAQEVGNMVNVYVTAEA